MPRPDAPRLTPGEGRGAVLLPLLDPIPLVCELLPGRTGRGLSSGLGILVNHLDDPARIVEDDERFAEKGEVVLSPSVRKLLPPRRPAPSDSPARPGVAAVSGARRP